MFTAQAYGVKYVILHNIAILITTVKMFTVQARRVTNVILYNTAIIIMTVKMFTVQAPISVKKLPLRVGPRSQDGLIECQSSYLKMFQY